MLEKITDKVTHALGSPWAMAAACALIVAWAFTGPAFQFGDTWQLVINTTTTIITFIMVFVIQSTQNRDSRAVQTKLDGLVKAMDGVENSLAGIERLPEAEIQAKQAEIDATDDASSAG